MKLPKNLSISVQGNTITINQTRRGQTEVITLSRKEATTVGILLVKQGE